MGVGVGVNVGVGVRVGVGVEVEVGVNVIVGVGVSVGPNNWPGLQAAVMASRKIESEVKRVFICSSSSLQSQVLAFSLFEILSLLYNL